MKNKTKEACIVVFNTLKEDKDYYRAWKDNIAMAFKNEWNSEQFQQSQQDSKALHIIANNAADNFLKTLIK